MSGEPTELDKFIAPANVEGVVLDIPTLEVADRLVANLATQAAMNVRLEDEPTTDQERRDNILRRNERQETLKHVAQGVALLLEKARNDSL